MNLEFTFEENHLPLFTVPKGLYHRGYLEKLCNDGLKERYGQPTDTTQRDLSMNWMLLKAWAMLDTF